MHPSDSDNAPDVAATDPDATGADGSGADGSGTDGPEADRRSSGSLSAVESGFDPRAARLWLWAAACPGAGGVMASALPSVVTSLVARAHGDSLLEELVDHASEANLFGCDRRVTVELTGQALESPDGHRLRLAGTWAHPWALWSPEYDPAGTEGLVVALARVADDAEDTVARSLSALVPGGVHRGRGH